MKSKSDSCPRFISHKRHNEEPLHFDIIHYQNYFLMFPFGCIGSVLSTVQLIGLGQLHLILVGSSKFYALTVCSFNATHLLNSALVYHLTASKRLYVFEIARASGFIILGEILLILAIVQSPAISDQKFVFLVSSRLCLGFGAGSMLIPVIYLRNYCLKEYLIRGVRSYAKVQFNLRTWLGPFLCGIVFVWAPRPTETNLASSLINFYTLPEWIILLVTILLIPLFLREFKTAEETNITSQVGSDFNRLHTIHGTSNSYSTDYDSTSSNDSKTDDENSNNNKVLNISNINFPKKVRAKTSEKALVDHLAAFSEKYNNHAVITELFLSGDANTDRETVAACYLESASGRHAFANLNSMKLFPILLHLTLEFFFSFILWGLLWNLFSFAVGIFKIGRGQTDLFFVFGCIALGGIIGWVLSMKRMFWVLNRYRCSRSEKTDQFGMMIGAVCFLFVVGFFAAASLLVPASKYLYYISTTFLGISMAWLGNSSNSVYRKQVMSLEKKTSDFHFKLIILLNIVAAIGRGLGALVFSSVLKIIGPSDTCNFTFEGNIIDGCNLENSSQILFPSVVILLFCTILTIVYNSYYCDFDEHQITVEEEREDIL